MNVLILGSGGREHTFAWKIAQSPAISALFVAPGNAGTAGIAQNLDIGVNDFKAIREAVISNGINLVIVGPEDPLVNGIHDFFLKEEALRAIPVIGPPQVAAQLEGSKEFAKEFMERHHIPTAAYKSFTGEQLQEGYDFLKKMKPPYVLKADGLAAGKGVLIIHELEVAKKELRAMLKEAKFGKASSKVVVEEFLDGIELSCFVLTDGKTHRILPLAKDYKRIGEGDTGLNTGGMGAVSPVPFADPGFIDKISERIVIPTVEGLKKDGIPYVGFIFIGLIKVGSDPLVIEYNVRMGDPETEVVIPRIKNDLLQLLTAVAHKQLDQVAIEVDERVAATVMTVSGGYPEAYEKGKKIEGLDKVANALPFHAGTLLKGRDTVTNGGRVLAITAFGKNYKEALKEAYQNVEKIRFDGINYRRDIGFDLGQDTE